MTGPRPQVGAIGRLGSWTAGHFRIVAAAWVVVAVGLGVLAPRVEKALSGAGWETTGSESVQARQLIDKGFDGFGTYGLTVVVHAPDRTVSDPAFERVLRAVEGKLKSEPAVATVMPPRAGVSISPDRHAAVIQAGAARNENDMVRAADELKGPLARLGSSGVRVDLTGAAGMWSDFNEANKSAMMRSELISWPVTLAILVLAFGSLVAAGLPLMLTIAGLVAAAGSLWIGTQIADISIWSMNFALMFALALGIDYALFIVYRFRGALFGSKLSAQEAVAATMDTAGKAVLFSGVTVLISLSAVMLVPSPAFRSTSLGIMLSVVFVLAAALTLLPAALAKLGSRVDRLRASVGLPGGASLAALGGVGRAALATAAALRPGGARAARGARAAGALAEDRDAVDQGRSRRATTPGRATTQSRRRSVRVRRVRCRSSLRGRRLRRLPRRRGAIRASRA